MWGRGERAPELRLVILQCLAQGRTEGAGDVEQGGQQDVLLLQLVVDLQAGPGINDVKAFFVYAVFTEKVHVVTRAHTGIADDAAKSSLVCPLCELLGAVVAGVLVVPVADVAGGVSGSITAGIQQDQGVQDMQFRYSHVFQF